MPTPEAVKGTRPRGVEQRWASSSVIRGRTWDCVNSVCPCESAAIVLTHGSPWVRFNAPRTSIVLRALLKPRAVSEARRLVAFGSLRAYAVVVVQGSGSEAPSEVTTGPYRVHHWVPVTGSPPWTAPVTRRSVIRSGLPSPREGVGR